MSICRTSRSPSTSPTCRPGSPCTVESGKLSVQGTASYRVTDEEGPEVAWDGTVEVTGIEISEHQGPGRVDVSGVAFRSRVSLGRKRGMILDGGSVDIRDLSVPFGGKDGMKLGLLSIAGMRYLQKENTLEVAGLLLADGKFRISRDRHGVFSPMPLLERLERKLPHGPPSSGEPIQYRVQRLEGKALDLAFTDGTRKELPSFTVSGVTFQAQDVTGPLAGPITFTVAARVGKGATVKTWGKFVPTPLAVDAELELKGFALADGGPVPPGRPGHLDRGRATRPQDGLGHGHPQGSDHRDLRRLVRRPEPRAPRSEADEVRRLGEPLRRWDEGDPRADDAPDRQGGAIRPAGRPGHGQGREAQPSGDPEGCAGEEPGSRLRSRARPTTGCSRSGWTSS